jgi:dTDP-4-amino-4,6-dideoxygalactose transaminase
VTVSARPVPFVDLRAQHEPIREGLAEAVQAVLASGRFVLGDQVARFEEEFASYCGVEHCVGVGSGSDALVLALRACGVGPGDEVITPSFTFIAAPFAVAEVGATPVFVDVDADTGLLDAQLAREAITPKTRAIIPVHLYGCCAGLDDLQTLSAEHGVWLIEDAAQAHGARSNARLAGAVGHVGCFSFYPSKNLGAFGDGGAVVTNDDKLAAGLRLLRNYGEARKYHHQLRGSNSRLDELQAALLRVKLPHLDDWNQARRAAADLYAGLLDRELCPPSSREQSDHVFHLYVVRSQRRDALRRYLADHDIETGIHYPVPVHRQPAFADIPHVVRELPVTDRLASEVLSLPMYPTISREQIVYVADHIKAGLTHASV